MSRFPTTIGWIFFFILFLIAEYQKWSWFSVVLEPKSDLSSSGNHCSIGSSYFSGRGKSRIVRPLSGHASIFFLQVYWCSRQQRISKRKSHPSELTSFSFNTIHVQTPRPKEIKLFPIIPKLVQPNSPPPLGLTLPNLNGETGTTDTCSTAGSSSSSTAIGTKKFRKKNLLERYESICPLFVTSFFGEIKRTRKKTNCAKVFDENHRTAAERRN